MFDSQGATGVPPTSQRSSTKRSAQIERAAVASLGRWTAAGMRPTGASEDREVEMPGDGLERRVLAFDRLTSELLDLDIVEDRPALPFGVEAR